MVKKLDFAEGEFSSLLNSSKYQKSSNFSKNSNKKAFSVAEAMITLLIGSLILGSMAPMISKQLKHNNLSDIQSEVFNKNIELLTQRIENLENSLNDVEDKIEGSIPPGAILIFNSNSYGNTGCPSGWTNVSNNIAGKYLMFDENKNVGKINKSNFPNHWHGVGAFYPGDNDMFFNKRNFQYENNSANGSGMWLAYGDSAVDVSAYSYASSFHGVSLSTLMQTRGIGTSSEIYKDTSDVSTSTNEIDVKPASLSVIACKKN